MDTKQLLNPIFIFQKRDRLGFHLHRLLNRWNIPVTAHDRALLALRDKHRGQRGFIIGTGPSLRLADLDRLQDEITFGCNKIYLAFRETDWRPTYYTVLDVVLAAQHQVQIQQLELTKIFSSWVKPYFSDSKDILWLRHIGPRIENGLPAFAFSSNALEGVYGGWTVIYTQLQLAFYLGIREIYLLGLDFYFDVPEQISNETSVHGNVVKSRGELNHFHPAYRSSGERWTKPNLEYQRWAFQCAKAAYEAHGGVVYNASRVTALDTFPRIDFDALWHT